MKKLIVAGFAALMCVGAFAAEARVSVARKDCRGGCMSEWTPFALTLVGPVGLPWGDFGVKGLQIGLYNSVYQLSGLQLGVVNVADRAYGMQIGIINVIGSDDCPFLPVLNWSF